MKVIFVTGGIPHYTIPLLEKIVANGIDLSVIIPDKKNSLVIGKGVKLENTENVSYKVRKTPIKKGWYGKPALTNLKKIISEENPDIVIFGWPFMLQLYFDRSILKVIKRLNIKIMIREIPFLIPPFGSLKYFKDHPVYDEDMHLKSKGICFYIKSLYTMWIRRFIYQHADASLNYCTEAYKILPSYGINKKNIFVTYNTIDTESLLKEREDVINTIERITKKKRILHIGRLVKWKRVDLLIKAFHIVLLKHPDLELLIIGDGPEKDNLEEQVRSLGIEKQVIFTGAIYDPFTLGKYMYESTIYVLAGMGGLSINEAMCYSLPVICSVCDGTEKDLIKDGINGYFFCEGDANSLAEKINILLTDENKRIEMGKKSFEIIRDKINMETVSQRFIEAFRKTVQK